MTFAVVGILGGSSKTVILFFIPQVSIIIRWFGSVARNTDHVLVVMGSVPGSGTNFIFTS